MPLSSELPVKAFLLFASNSQALGCMMARLCLKQRQLVLDPLVVMVFHVILVVPIHRHCPGQRPGAGRRSRPKQVMENVLDPPHRRRNGGGHGRISRPRWLWKVMEEIFPNPRPLGQRVSLMSGAMSGWIAGEIMTLVLDHEPARLGPRRVL